MGRVDTRELLRGAAPSLRVQSTHGLGHDGSMLPNRRVILGLQLLALPILSFVAAAHAKESPGVNQFTAPPIAELLVKAEALQPIPFEKVWRDPPARASTERARLALQAGSTIADGFLVISCEKRSRVEVVGRSLLRSAKALGFGDQISARSRHIVDEAEKDHWAVVRRELTGAQSQAEAALRNLRDDDLVQLLALEDGCGASRSRVAPSPIGIPWSGADFCFGQNWRRIS